MLDRDEPRAALISRRPMSERLNAAATVVVALCGIIGAAGVVLSAASTHGGGGTLASTAGLFLILHAASGVGLASFVRSVSARGLGLGLLIATLLLMIGATVFSADLAMMGFAAVRPFPGAAPLGGIMMIAGWLGIPIAVLFARWHKG